jgi:hypothetical protein
MTYAGFNIFTADNKMLAAKFNFFATALLAHLLLPQTHMPIERQKQKRQIIHRT